MVGRRSGLGPAGQGHSAADGEEDQRRKRVILAGGMVAIGTKKMSVKNAQSIEEHIGVPPETLILKKPFGRLAVTCG